MDTNMNLDELSLFFLLPAARKSVIVDLSKKRGRFTVGTINMCFPVLCLRQRISWYFSAEVITHNEYFEFHLFRLC